MAQFHLRRSASTLSLGAPATSRSRSGCRTQRIEARLLLVIQRIVEFLERRLNGLRRSESRVEPLLHCLNATRGSQRLVSRAIHLELFRGPDGGVLQFVERALLDRRGLDRLGDPVDRQVGDAGRSLIAKLREIALVLFRGAGIVCQRDGVEASLLLVTERLVKTL